MRPRNPIILIACASAMLALAPRMGAADPVAPAAAPAQVDPRFQEPATDDGLPGAGPIHRSDWFQKLWAERRAEWASQAQEDQGAIVFLGDSITQGWGDVGSSFPGIKTANRGISGDTSRGVLIRLQDVIAVNPRGVVLLIGTNDIGDGVEPEVIAGNMKLIIAALRAHDPSMPVVLCEVFPSSTSKSRPADKIRKLNDLYMEAVADQPQVTVLDTWSLFKDVHGDAKEQEMPDLLHPDMVGYAKWASALRPVLETVGLAPAWPDNFIPEPGFAELFNGRDLTGWGYVGHPGFTGKTATDDGGRFVARNGRLIVTVSRKGREIKKLWTARVFPRDFTLKLEFRASPNADSGIFIREPQLQCRDFIIAGPFAMLEHYRPLDWNEIVVTVRGRLAHCTCNGEVIADAMPVPATGSIGLESDRGQVEYRRIRVEEAR
jgi:lysophospholipase L1-like esterase